MIKKLVTRPTLFLLVLVIGFGSALSSSAASASPELAMTGPVITISERDSDEYSPDIAYNSVHDEYLVVWENAWGSGGYHDVYAQRVAADGRLLSWFAVSTNTVNQINPSVAYDPIRDRYLIVFALDVFGNGYDWDIWGRFIPWNGPDPTIPDFSICDWTTQQGKPAVAFGQAQDEFLVTWTNFPVGQPTYLSGRRIYAAGGYPSGPDPFPVTFGPENRNYSAIAYNLARNEYLVTWDMEINANDINIAGIRLRGDGVALTGGDPVVTGEFVIAGWPDYEELPAVAACWMSDQYLVAWQSDQGTSKTDFAIYARYLNGDAIPGSVYLISDTPSPQRNVDVACGFLAMKYLLIWQDRYVGGEDGIWGRIAYPSQFFESEFEVMGPRSMADRQYPAVSGGKTNYLTAWEHDRDGGNLDIHGRLLGFFGYLPLLKR